MLHLAEVSLEHLLALTIDDEGCLRVVAQDQSEGSGVVRLHMIDDDVVELVACESRLELSQEAIGVGDVDGIEEDVFLILDQVRVVRHPVGDRPKVLEESCLAIVDAEVVGGVIDFYDGFHCLSCECGYETYTMRPSAGRLQVRLYQIDHSPRRTIGMLSH